MSLAGLLPLLHNVDAYHELVRQLEAPAAAPRLGLLEAAKPYLIAGLQRDLARPILIVVAQPRRAQQLYEQLLAWSAAPSAVALLPTPEAFFYEQLAWGAQLAQERLLALALLRGGDPPGGNGGSAAAVVVTMARALMQPMVAPEDLAAQDHALTVGSKVELEGLLARWLKMGYEPSLLVAEPGTFARRGGILDIFPPTYARPARIELCGDEIETIRLFDSATQRSTHKIERVLITAPRELPAYLGPAVAEALAGLDLDGCRPEVAERFQRDLARLKAGEGFVGAEYYAAYWGQATIADYLPPHGLLVLDEPRQVWAAIAELAEQAANLREELSRRGELPRGLPKAYRDEAEIRARLEGVKRQLAWDWEAAPNEGWERALSAAFRSPPLYGGRLKQVLDDSAAALRRGQRVVLASFSAAPRLAELCRDRGIPATLTAPGEAAPAPGRLALVEGLSLAEGWRSEPLNLLVLTDGEIFGWAKPRALIRRRPAAPALWAELSPGDYAVHGEYGIGRFLGLVKRDFDGAEREYLLLEYAEGDRLYVPSDNADRVARYLGPTEPPPTLHRLGGAEWVRTKERVQAAVRDIAQELLQIYATREIRPGHAFGPDSPWQAELEASFPYIETPDQLEAIAAVKADMEEPQPMDRLVCGDVGYGKTEVALRAAFKAVTDGKQVAFLVPTTVLAQQHYRTFCQRLTPFPIRVEVLSRFRSQKEQQEVLAGLKLGQIDICIGTHRLLQKDVAFKNLGLVIIDEEHRFGVLHKEHLKQLRQEVDVLTLTATPIPRTFYMALGGLREMSTMETPPEERLPIKTFVTEYDEGLIREVILRELERGGQVYFVHNRVRGLRQVAQRLARLVPEARIAVGHGQMPEAKLEQVMLDFAAGRHDVLVCTTIIEAGLDIPNANTLIVHQADRFGLAQLYQLRGRVGRGASRAYAYFLFGKGQRLLPAAEKRLRTIFEATELGAGFRIALRDLEIRGAGNLLGREQHGHLAAVGFDLYCRMLAEAVQELRGQPLEKPKPTPTVHLPLAAYLPHDYVPEEAVRLNLYQRMAAAEAPEEVAQLALEMRDRFGPPPPPAVNLLYILHLKALAARAGVRAIAAQDKELVVNLAPGAAVEAQSLTRRFGSAVKVRAGQIGLVRPRLGRDWMAALQDLMELLAEAAAPNSAGPKSTA